MTEEEQKRIFGEVDTKNIVAITKLRTKDGLEAPGYGKWPKEKEPYGTDKGNTKANMAFIRSERNAFGRLSPDALPVGVEVIDEAYAEVPEIGKVEKKTGEIIIPEPEAEPEPVKPEICKDCPTWDECQGGNQEDCEHRGKEASEASPLDETPVTEDDLAQLNKLMAENSVSASQLGAYMNKDKGWNIKVTTELKKWQLNELLEAFKKGKE